MPIRLPLIAAAAFSLIATGAFAAAPADAPAGTTGACKDGTYVSAAEKKGACKGHKGIKDWYSDAGAAAKSPAMPGMAPSAAPGMASSGPMKTSRKGSAGDFTPAATPAPGGGPGMVWANDSSKVYHCSTDKWYGKTKHGEYLSEADAKAKGFHAEHGKACAG